MKEKRKRKVRLKGGKKMPPAHSPSSIHALASTNPLFLTNRCGKTQTAQPSSPADACVGSGVD
jgi:hypothetical protein